MGVNEIILPPYWSWVKLGDVSKRIHYGYTASAENKNVGPKLLRITDIQDGKVNWSEIPYCAIPNDDIHKYLLGENDIVFARTGATVGKSFLIRGKIPATVFASYLIRLQLSDKTLPKFIYLFFQSNNYWSQIISSSAGIGQPNVNAQKLSNLIIPLPPLPEQKKIVEKIEELFSGLDSGVASLKKAKEQIKLYRQSVLAHAFSGRLCKNLINQIPTENNLPEGLPAGDLTKAGWKWVKLGDTAQIINGYAFKSGDLKNQGKYQVVKIGNVRPGNLRLESKPAFINEVDEEILRRSLLHKNDLVISLTGTRKKRDYGYVAMVTNQKKLLLNQRLATIRLNKEFDSKFFLYLLRMDIFLDQFFRNETGNVGQGNVGIGGIRDSVVPVPPFEEQTQIVEEIEKRFSEADNLEKAINESLEKSEALRQSILKQAFEGKLI